MSLKPAIKEPCPADWDKMKIGVNSRFCESCSKHVVDFTEKSRDEILEYLLLHYGEKTCGHFYRSQLDYWDGEFEIRLNRIVAKQKDPSRALQILIIGSLFLNSCAQPNVEEKTSFARNDTLEQLIQTDSIQLINADSTVRQEDPINEVKKLGEKRCSPKLNTALLDSLVNDPKVIIDQIIEGEVLLGDIDVIRTDSLGEGQQEIDSNKVYPFYITDVKAEFPGGMEGLITFIKNTIVYPEDSATSPQGKVYVNFVIRKDGAVDDIEIVRSIHESLDQEVIRVMKLMPDWKPAENNGEKVASSFTLPVNFRRD